MLGVVCLRMHLFSYQLIFNKFDLVFILLQVFRS
jgi:hypothetical protein